MREFVIDKNGDGQRLDKFMMRVMPSVGQGGVYKALRKKKVRVNGKHTDGAYRLTSGDLVQMYISDDFFESAEVELPWMSAPVELAVVYEDENILVADKPSGMPSQASDASEDSLESRVRSYLYKKGEVDLNAQPPFVPSLCHRIDRNTAGLVIAAKNAAALRIINQKIKDREIRKFYLCETARAPEPKSGTISGMLVRDGRSRKMIFCDKQRADAAYCETVYRTIKAGSPALVEAELMTGRTHQIRACFSHIGCPLVGDVKYGARKTDGNEYQHLTAYKLIFNFKTDAGALEYLNGKIIKKERT